MKGLLDTSVILKAVLNKEWGLRTDSLLSHVMVYEADFYPKLLVTTDGGMNIAPNYEQKVKILKNAIKATEPLGLETIKVCALAAKEKVNPKMQATVDAKELEDACKNGEFGENVIVEGPLAFDLAVSKEACEVKGFKTEVGGDVDSYAYNRSWKWNRKGIYICSRGKICWHNNGCKGSDSTCIKSRYT